MRCPDKSCSSSQIETLTYVMLGVQILKQMGSLPHALNAPEHGIEWWIIWIKKIDQTRLCFRTKDKGHCSILWMKMVPCFGDMDTVAKGHYPPVAMATKSKKT